MNFFLDKEKLQKNEKDYTRKKLYLYNNGENFDYRQINDISEYFILFLMRYLRLFCLVIFKLPGY